MDKHGGRTIEVPISYNTSTTAKKAIMRLWNLQREATTDFPSAEPNPGNDPLIVKAYKTFRQSLVFDETFKGSTRTGTCLIRDPYTERQFITMMAFCWRMQEPLRLPSDADKRAYNSKKRFPHTRERFSLAARHHMLLRDEDIRNRNLSDLFSVQCMHSGHGSKLALGLAFCINRGKTNTTGVKVYSLAFRHKNYLRCTVSAFAFYMLERFQVSLIPMVY